MISDVQREALAALAEVWAMSPDVRFGQLLAHLGFLGEAHFDRGLGYLDDDEMMALLYRHRAELAARLKSPHERDPEQGNASTSISGGLMTVDTVPPAKAGQ